MAKGNRRVLLSSPTGSGKTEIGFEIIRAAQAKGTKVAFLANRISLIDQTSRRLSEAGFLHGVIQGENTAAPWRSVLVCSIQTVAKRGLPEGLGLLVVDEAHACAGTKAYHEVMKDIPVIGLTATPYSPGLGREIPGLGGPLFQDVVTAARIKDLIRDGFLVSAEIWAPGEPDLSKVKITAGDYNETQLGEAVDTAELVGDIVSHWFKLAGDEATVVFATNIAHSKHICRQFTDAGVKAEHLDCYTTDDDRRAILARVSSGETKVVCNVGVLAEGWDFPACKVLVLARPTKSLIRYLQMAGRVLRPFPGKEQALILDHSGSVIRLGFPWENFDRPLCTKKPGESAGKEQERTEPLPKKCPQCNYVKPPRTPICPECGFEATKPCDIECTDGNLVPLTEVKESKAIKALKDIGRQSVYSQLLFIADKHKWATGWAAHKYKLIFGTWPNRQDQVREEPCHTVLAWVQSQNIRYIKGKAKANGKNS
jgi:superfamily II DNA or RNA helicase